MSRQFHRARYFAGVAMVSAAVVTVQGQSPPPHVRAVSARLASALRVLGRSATFRDLVARVDESDLIVHLTEVEGGCDGGLMSCTTVVGEHAGVRYVRIQIAWMQPTARVLGQLAHEMQHAVELIERKDIRANAAICDGLGWHSQEGRCETREAQDVQRKVLAELAASR